MDKKKLIISLVILVLGLALLLYFFRDKIFGKTTADGASQDGEPYGFPLQRGSQNEFVRKYQEYLISKENCLPNFGADGDWGSETEACSLQVTGKNVITWKDYKNFGLA